MILPELTTQIINESLKSSLGITVGDAIKAGLIAAAEWFWKWTQGLSYWVAALGGTVSLILFFATHEKKYKTSAIAMVIIYLIIAAVGSVI